MFAYPGGAVLHVYDALFQQNQVNHILVRHEQAATHDADDYARANGKHGVVLVTYGTGATNAIAGIGSDASAVTSSARPRTHTGSCPAARSGPASASINVLVADATTTRIGGDLYHLRSRVMKAPADSGGPTDPIAVLLN